jgi:short-subunit dehydrogenase
MIQINSLGPWVVVTGASSGLGEGFARALARRGLHLVLAARTADRLGELGEQLSAEHKVAHRVVPVDLTAADGPAHLLDRTADLDAGLLVSNAGAGRPGEFLDSDLTDLHRRLRLNATTHLELAHGFGRRFAARGAGGIVLVSALGATEGIPHMAHEAASKAYVASLGSSLHYELAPGGVAVTVMLPGNVDTPIIDSFAVDRSKLPFAPYPVDRAVEEALGALLRGRPRLVPDRRMRWMTRLTPRGLRVRANGRMLGRAAVALAARNTESDHAA